MNRGEVYRLRPERKGRGHEQQGARYGVIVQSDDLLPLSTVIVAPTSRNARPTAFRPEVEVRKATTRVLTEQTGVTDVDRLGELVGRLDADEQRALDHALATVLGLR